VHRVEQGTYHATFELLSFTIIGIGTYLRFGHCGGAAFADGGMSVIKMSIYEMNPTTQKPLNCNNMSNIGGGYIYYIIYRLFHLTKDTHYFKNYYRFSNKFYNFKSLKKHVWKIISLYYFFHRYRFSNFYFFERQHTF